jgi:hypothetical protein
MVELQEGWWREEGNGGEENQRKTGEEKQVKK